MFRYYQRNVGAPERETIPGIGMDDVGSNWRRNRLQQERIQFEARPEP